MQRLLILFVLIAALGGCDRSKLQEGKYLKAGGDAVLPLKRSLKAALVSGLEGGAVNAISACRTEAPKLAEEASRPKCEGRPHQHQASQPR